jgi:MFS/sugar transport protein
LADNAITHPLTQFDRQHSEGFALSGAERVGYGMGSLATATFAVVPSLVPLYYLTDVLGVSAAVAGFVVFLPKLLDLVYNPIADRLSDSTVSRLGPRRPWMAVGAVVLPLGFVGVFFSPFDGSAAAWRAPVGGRSVPIGERLDAAERSTWTTRGPSGKTRNNSITHQYLYCYLTP